MTNDIIHLSIAEPPEFLFYAVDVDSSDEVFRHGIKRRKAPLIEMYRSTEEARLSVKRGKQPLLFAIVARVMADDGYRFYHADTGEWFTDEVPSRYVRLH